MADCEKCLHKNVCWFMHGWRNEEEHGTVFHCGFYEDRFGAELLVALKTLHKHCDGRMCSQCALNMRRSSGPVKCKLNEDIPAFWDTIIHEMEENKDGNYECENN